jgi:hypothetical protein
MLDPIVCIFKDTGRPCSILARPIIFGFLSHPLSRMKKNRLIFIFQVWIHKIRMRHCSKKKKKKKNVLCKAERVHGAVHNILAFLLTLYELYWEKDKASTKGE